MPNEPFQSYNYNELRIIQSAWVAILFEDALWPMTDKFDGHTKKI